MRKPRNEAKAHQEPFRHDAANELVAVPISRTVILSVAPVMLGVSAGINPAGIPVRLSNARLNRQGCSY